MKLVETKTNQEVLYMYDSVNEWVTEYDKMMQEGWKCGGKNKVIDGKYYQRYSKVTN